MASSRNAAVVESLTPAEGRELAKLEQAIEDGLRTFYDVGLALQRIRDERLYRATHRTFEAYLTDRWDIHRDTAYAKIAAVEVVKNVGNSDKRPNESQASQLVGLEPEQQQKAWQQAVATAPKGKVTAAHVAKVVEEITGRPPGADPGEISVDVAQALAALPAADRHELLTRCEEEATADRRKASSGGASGPARDHNANWPEIAARVSRAFRALRKCLKAAGPEGERADGLVEQAAAAWEEDAAGQDEGRAA